jgi:DNA-binding beta-propeller fold protein YncE
MAIRVACGAVAIFAATLTLGSSAALGALSYPFDGQLAPSGGSFELLKANSVAVDSFNGDTYVADSGVGVVDVFDSTGAQLASLDATMTPAGSFGGSDVAVAANNGTGAVYVLDTTDGVVDEFDAGGSYVCQITGSSTPSTSECNGVSGSDTPAHGFSAPQGVAIDQATGELYVVDANNGVVDIFSPAGAYERQILFSSAPEEVNPDTSGIAVDDVNEQVYLADEGTDVVYQFDSTGAYVATLTGENTPAGSFGGGFVSVAADNTSGNFYVTANTDTEAVVDVFAPDGESIGQIHHPFNVPRGIAVDQASGKVYVSENEPTVVGIFGPAELIPDVATGLAQAITPTGAELEGTVNPDELQITDCTFEYGTDSSYGQTVACVPAAGTIPPDANPHQVSASLSGLEPGQSYHFRLKASNSNGTSFGEDETFSTPPPPSIEGAEATELTGVSADLSARIDPHGFDTTYRFEWGTSAAYGNTIPVPDADIGSGSSPVAVATHLSGLSTNTTYHWRVVATNANGTTNSPDHTFTYDTTGAGLPDGRAYEMVTPTAKNAALIGDVFHGLVPDVAEDGSRLMLTSIQCFADARSCTGARGEVGSPYAFTRAAGGWTANALSPPADEFGAPTTLRVSAQAGTALFSSSTPPTGEDHFYARHADGSLADIGPATSPETGPLGPSSYSATPLVATADLSHVVYVDEHPVWAFDTGAGQSVYEYSGTGNTSPSLVGVSGGLGSTDLISACGTYLGGSGDIPVDLDGSLSADGRIVYFTAKACEGGTNANAGTPVPVDALYARLDSSETVAISERSGAECTTPACQGSPPGDALFDGASADGSKVVFASVQQLTDGAAEDGETGDTAAANGCPVTAGLNGCNLYLYDFANPSGRRLIDLSAGDTSGHGPRVQGVMAISADGSHVYFVAKGVLGSMTNAQGQVPRDGAENLYAFEREPGQAGHLAFVTRLPQADSGQWAFGPEQANVTPDGRFLVFTSHAALTPDDARAEGPAQVYRYDAQDEQLLRVSIGENGFNDNGNSGSGDASIVAASGLYSHAGPVRADPTMSNDGSYVFFQSSVALTSSALDEAPIDAAGVRAQNIYEWHKGRVALISDGRDASPVSQNGETDQSAVRLLGSDASGSNVFFSTVDQLVEQDTDGELDYYDARICTPDDPCIVAPLPPVPPCQSATCHEPPSKTAPPPPSVGTLNFSGPGNLLSPGSAGSESKRVRLLGSSLKGSRLVLRLAIPGKGRVTIRGSGIRLLRRSIAGPGSRTLRLALTPRAQTAVRAGRRLRLKLRVEWLAAGGAVVRTNLTVAVRRSR